MKEKSKKTCQERYGVDNGGGSQKALDKMKKHFIEKYGVDNPWKSKEIIEKNKTNTFRKVRGCGLYTNRRVST